MNYITQLNAFDEWATINCPSTGQYALYHALLAINNKCGWKEWFAAPNSIIEARTGLTKMGINKARNFLIENALIEIQMRKGNQATLYRMCQIVDAKVYSKVDAKESIGGIVDSNVYEELTQKFTFPKHSSSPNVIDSSPSKVEQHFILKRNRGFGLTTDDYAAIHEIINYKIPVEFIFDVIDKAFKEYKPKYPRDGITNFTYIAPRIYKEWHLKQEKEKGVQSFEKHGRSDEGVRPGSDQKKGAAEQGESKVYRGKWDDTEVPMPKVSG